MCTYSGLVADLLCAVGNAWCGRIWDLGTRHSIRLVTFSFFSNRKTPFWIPHSKFQEMEIVLLALLHSLASTKVHSSNGLRNSTYWSVACPFQYKQLSLKPLELQGMVKKSPEVHRACPGSHTQSTQTKWLAVTGSGANPTLQGGNPTLQRSHASYIVNPRARRPESLCAVFKIFVSLLDVAANQL